MITYEFYVNDEGDWYGVFVDDGYYICVQQDTDNPFTTFYPIDNDPENWINTVEHYNSKEKA